MKKIIIGAATAAILTTAGFAAQVLDVTDVESGLFDTIYVETALGVNNGNNDMILTVGSRELVNTDLLGVGMIDLSGTASMEKQFDFNARYSARMIEGILVFASLGAESFNTTVNSVEGGGAPACLTYTTDANGDQVCKTYEAETFETAVSTDTKNFNLYSGVGVGTLITPNLVVLAGLKVGTEKIDLYAETSYKIDQEIYVTLKVGKTVFNDINDNQHDGLTTLVGVGYSF